MIARRLIAAFAAAGAIACGGGADRPAGPAPVKVVPPRGPVVIAVIGTNDLHGHIEKLPVFGGYLAILREAMPGRVLLVDGGDMFQGTLESNLTEGASVIDAYNALGYHAATTGNHEFDFGPAGDRTTPRDPDDDPQGALKARGGQAAFPILTANIRRAGGAPVDWKNMPASTMVELQGIKIGIVGVTTEGTPRVTIASNFAGLEMAPIADTITAEARKLREHGAEVIVVASHEGGSCQSFDDPDVLDSCVADAEIFEVARALAPGTVDVIVAGHSHAGVAHRVNGIAIIESFANGTAFGRVDLTIEPGRGVTKAEIHPPRRMCVEGETPCQPDRYMDRDVVPDPKIEALIAGPTEAARHVRERSLGLTVESKVERSYGKESPLGNLIADLMLAARPRADVAITNGGGLRADLPAGELTYGGLYETTPFDNRFALVELTGRDLKKLLAANLQSRHGILSVGGIRVTARCKGSELDVEIRDRRGKRIADSRRLVLATSDFLATGGDGMFARAGIPQSAVTIEEEVTIRDAMAEVLTARAGGKPLRGDDRALFDPQRPRLRYPGSRPVACR